jgi:hypothetical protein
MPAERPEAPRQPSVRDPVLEGALLPGVQPSAHEQTEVRDFDPDSGTLAIRQSKAGKPRRVVWQKLISSQ